MDGRFLIGEKHSVYTKTVSIYTDKAAVIVFWLLQEGVTRKDFSIREVAVATQVSVGLVQKVFKYLINKGLLNSRGIRTSKSFFISKPQKLLADWIKNYHIVKKCKIRTYRSAFTSVNKMIRALDKSGLSKHVTLALHSAAAAYSCKNTNIETLELYVIDKDQRMNIETELNLEEQEKGYQVLLIEPYYKALLNLADQEYQGVKISPEILTFLDLFHFPLRGNEQAIFMAERIKKISRIFKLEG